MLRQSRALAVAFVTLGTFTDIVAYSIAVPVLPDLSRKLGASPTMIGLLFASFGVTLLIFVAIFLEFGGGPRMRLFRNN